ncbi:hypothetical protein TWF730_011070 [Orbilia blumenaviensis]|uniref:Uncharacterized protein n=1 Tax=Orbilia blumenaviensis TaxID=1796055 RepID=A0AAV9UJB5_9PEZI
MKSIGLLLFGAASVLAAAISPEEKEVKEILRHHPEVLAKDVVLWGNGTDTNLALSKRTPGGIYICLDVGWNNCGYKVQPLKTCIGLDAPWWHTISSFGPDECTSCVLHTDKYCESECPDGYKCVIHNPGFGDLREYTSLGAPYNWNDKIGSFWCTTSYNC